MHLKIMFSGLKKGANVDAKNEYIRNAETKRRLITELSLAVKELQRKHIGADLEVERNDEHGLLVSCLLEAILLHGYHEQGVKMSNFYNLLGKISTEAMPSHSFWPLIVNFTHKDILHELEHLSQIHTNVGRCRAWVRLALNDGLMESYLDTLLMDKPKLRECYKPFSFMLDAELPSIMKTFLQGLGEFKFDFNYNTPGLNTWSSDTLAYCGIWQLPKVVQHPLTYSSGIHSHTSSATPFSIPLAVSQQISQASTAQMQSSGSSDAEVAELAGASIEDSLEIEHIVRKREVTADRSRAADEVEKNLSLQDSSYSEEENVGAEGFVSESFSQNGGPRDAISPTPLMGSNKLGVAVGWSSRFETQMSVESSLDQTDNAGILLNLESTPFPTSPTKLKGMPSFCSLLKDYKVQGPDRFEAPVYEESVLPKATALPEQIPDGPPKSSVFDHVTVEAGGFEVLPKRSSVTSVCGDEKRTKELMLLLTEIANEQGLDSQNYQCKGCGRNIGMIYGEFKVCTYDACYYCFECHENEEHVIPARVIHNWDLRKHQVSKQCKLFLLQIEEEPLFNIDETNPTLYNVIKELREVKLLRSQLQHLKGFVFTCKDSIAEEVRRRIWPREYLWDDIHQYSLLDLIQVQTGQLAHHLKKIISHCTKHVYKCKLCRQKGFFCEICNNPKIIYPFEVKITSQCGKCKALYHKACILNKKCPKCIRRRKLQSAKTETPAVLEFDSPW